MGIWMMSTVWKLVVGFIRVGSRECSRPKAFLVRHGHASDRSKRA